MANEENGKNLRLYLTREPVILALLSVSAVVLFLAVTGLSRAYHAQQESLGNRWFTRGVTDLQAGRFDRAVNEFRTALLYSRDNYSYQFNLAEALVGLKRTDEAYAYLINLWEREPENGLVNRELARIAAQKGEAEQALRYYHNAIYAIWPVDQEVERRNTRLEVIEFLLRINAKAQAQAELIALAANIGDDLSQQAHVGDLFLRAQDYEHALAAYRLSLKANRHNPAALAGAGWPRWNSAATPSPDAILRRRWPPIPAMRKALLGSRPQSWYCASTRSAGKSRRPSATRLSWKLLPQRVSGSSLARSGTAPFRREPRSRVSPKVGRR